MKQTLLILIIAGLVGCSNQKEYERGYENGALSCADYNYYKGDYPSYGFRAYLRERRIKLPHDEELIDSIHKAYLSTWVDFERESVYSEDTIRFIPNTFNPIREPITITDSLGNIIEDTAKRY